MTKGARYQARRRAAKRAEPDQSLTVSEAAQRATPSRQTGEKNGRAKLTWVQVGTIRRMKGIHTGPYLARYYKVHETTIYAIWRKETWKE